MFFGNCTEIWMDAYQYTNYKSNDLWGRIYKSTHSDIQKGMDSHWDKDLLCSPAVQSESWLDVPKTDADWAIVPETTCYLFMLLLLLLNYDLWLLFFFFFFECFKKKIFKSVDLLMYSAFAAMDQNQETRVDKSYCISRKLLNFILEMDWCCKLKWTVYWSSKCGSKKWCLKCLVFDVINSFVILYIVERFWY